MVGLHLWVAFSMLFSMVMWKIIMRRSETESNGSKIKNKVSNEQETKHVGNAVLLVLLGSALVLRLILAAMTPGFEVDMLCFASWGGRMAEVGPVGFYADDIFADYPPLYLYILGGIGFLRQTFDLEWLSPMHLMLLKLPSALADIGIGCVIYGTACKQLRKGAAICLASLYLFQPVVIMNSCLWGQIDSLFTFFLVLVCVFLQKKQYLPAFLFYGTGMLLKPQMMIFAPIIILAFLNFIRDDVIAPKNEEDKRGTSEFMKMVGAGIVTGMVMLGLSLPFGLDHVLAQYLDTVSSYPYATVKAYNLWAGLKLNWYPQETVVAGLPCATWGTISIVLTTLFSLLLGWKMKKNEGRFGLVGAFLIISVFTFSVRMHERYLFPFLALMLIAYPGLAQMESKRMKTFYGVIFTILVCLHLYNTGHVLYYSDLYDFSADQPIMILTGLGMTATAILFYVLCIWWCKEIKKNIKKK